MTDHAVSSPTSAATGLAPRTRIKLCGLSRPEDVLHAAALGADALPPPAPWAALRAMLPKP